MSGANGDNFRRVIALIRAFHEHTRCPQCDTEDICEQLGEQLRALSPDNKSAEWEDIARAAIIIAAREITTENLTQIQQQAIEGF